LALITNAYGWTQITDAIWALTHVGLKNRVLDGEVDTPQNGHF